MTHRNFNPSNKQRSHHIETSQLISRANQLTGFYMWEILVNKGLRQAQCGNTC